MRQSRIELFVLFMVVLLLVVPLFINMLNGDESSEGDNESSGQEEKNGNDSDNIAVEWGVDSASYTTSDMLACVNDNFGDPKVWGRYLGEIDGVSEPLDEEEVEYLHENDIKILVIYNLVTDATGYDHGAEHAEQAIEMAEQLDIPEGVALFVDIEPDFPVDSSFMEGWYEVVNDSQYEPAVYGVFNEGSELSDSFLQMDEEIQSNLIVWTAYPQEGITTEEEAPNYEPEAPESAQVIGWQYGLDAEACNIDTNLFNEEMLDYLW